jgi:hypothetical protein
MRLGMGMCLSLQQSQALTLRQTMEERLIQDMRITQVQKLELKQYLEREDSFKRLYRDALKDGRVAGYNKHGLKFEFALVGKKELEGSIRGGDSCGYAHVLYDPWEALFHGQKIAMARGSWLLFVVPDFFAPIVMPKDIIQFVAVHEHGEEITLGQHYLATKLEFAVSRNERKIAPYLLWLENNYTAKFVDVFSNATRIVLPDSDEFQRELELRSKAEYAKRVREMIEGFEWPFRALQKMSLFQKRSKDVQGLILGVYTSIAHRLSEAMPIDANIGSVVKALRDEITDLLRKRAKPLSHYICASNLQGAYREVRPVLVKAFDQLRNSRRAMLDGRGELARFVEEIASLGTSGFPSDGVFSSDIKEVLSAL